MQGLRREKDKAKCGSNQNRVEICPCHLCKMCVMKLEFQGVLEYVQDIQPYREIDTIFIEEWSKDELRNRVYEEFEE